MKKSRTTAIMQPTLTTTIEQSSATPFTRAETSVADRRLYLMEKLFRVESVKGRLVNFIKRELFIKINPQFYRIINAKNSISPPVTFKASKNLMATHERQMRPANNFWRYYEDQRLELCEEDYSLTQFITDDENDVTSEDAKELTETQTQNPTKNDEEA